MAVLPAAAASASGSANADDGGLEVYCDDQNGAPEAPAGAWRNLPAYQETRKENSRAATAWAGQRLKQKRSRPGQAGAPPPGPTLEVYQDEDLVLAEEQAAADAAAAARRPEKRTGRADVWTRAARSSPTRTPRPTPFCFTGRARRRAVPLLGETVQPVRPERHHGRARRGE